MLKGPEGMVSWSQKACQHKLTYPYDLLSHLCHACHFDFPSFAVGIISLLLFNFRPLKYVESIFVYQLKCSSFLPRVGPQAQNDKCFCINFWG